MRALSNTTNLNVNGPPPDRCYGGKLTFKSREERGAQAKHPAMPVSPVPKSEPPRVLNDPTYSESSSGCALVPALYQKTIAAVFLSQ